MKKFVLGIAAIAALGFATVSAATPYVPKPSPSPDLRAEVACSPLTNSQLAQAGDSQLCRIRIRNFSAYPIENVTFSRPTPNTITARYSVGWKAVPCDLSGCESFTLGAYETVLINEESTFNPYQDGRGLTKVTAYGTQVVERVGKPTLYISLVASGTEQKSLP